MSYAEGSIYFYKGWSALLPRTKLIDIQPNHVIVCGKRYGNIRMADVLDRLSQAPKKSFSLDTFLRYQSDTHPPERVVAKPNADLTLTEVRRQVQDYITADTSLVVETGDSWFIGQYLKLPEGCRYHVQMQYGSIGWSVGAVLGAALAVGDSRRVLALIGDGSFQMTAQEVSTMIRQGVKCTILLLNNKGYTIEVEIHDGPYNDTKNWDYAQLVDTFNAEDGTGLGLKASTGEELEDALEKADKHPGVTLIEVALQRDDCTEELLLWGTLVAAANARV
jgi:TPP-dependent 2-oxoacid decarboxylase